MNVKSLLACSLLALLATRPVLAQSPNTEEAREHFSRGVEFFKDQSYDAALAEFQRAYSLAPNYRLLYNLAQVQLERHDYASALKYLQDYLAAGGSELDAERRTQVSQDIARLKSKVARLLVRSDIDGAEVSVGGSVVGKTPMASPVIINPGVVQVRVVREGYQTETRTLTVVGADEQVVNVSMTPGSVGSEAPAIRDDAALTETVPNRAEPRHSYTAAWVGVGVTAALGVGTTVFALRSKSADSELDDRLNAFPGQPSRIDDARSQLRTAALVTDILAVSTAVAAGLTLYFVLSPSTETAPARSQAGVGLAPAPGGVVVFGRL